MTVSFTQSWVFKTKRLLIIENLNNIEHAFQGRPSIFIGGGERIENYNFWDAYSTTKFILEEEIFISYS